MTTASPARWYVVHTHAHAEAKAALNLQRQNFEIYLPRYLKRRRHARRVEIVPAPLFPRYLFVAIDTTAQRWRSVQSTFGVGRLVCTCDEPAAVPDGVIDDLRRHEDARGYIRLARRPQFAQGDKIRVLDGVFCDCLGMFEGMTDGDRVAILLDLLGRKVKVVLDVECVAAA